MAENIFSTFTISGEGLTAQRRRLASIAKNIANVNTTKCEDGEPYRREITVVSAIQGQGNTFGNELKEQLTLIGTEKGHFGGDSLGGSSERYLKTDTVKDQSDFRMVYDPSHPHAGDDGYVKMPNINIVTEMVEMISAQKAFESNANVIESAKSIARDSLEI